MLLLFRARACLCALPLVHVVETMRPLPVEPMAGTPPCVRGLAVIRGVPVPVVDVAQLLGEGATPRNAGEPSPARFVMVRVADRGVALAVEEVIGVRPLALAALHGLPPLLRDAKAEVVNSIGTLDSELLLLLRSARLMPQSLHGTEGPS